MSDASKVVPFPPNPNSPNSTINTVEREIREAGDDATAVQVDTRDFESVQRLVEQTIEVRWWSPIEHTTVVRYSLHIPISSNPADIWSDRRLDL